MRLSAITDEIADDLPSALAVCEELGISTVELRTVDGTNVVEHDAPELRRIASALSTGGFDCRVVDTPFFKESVQWRHLERGIDAAHVLGAGTLRVFSGPRAAGPDSIAAAAEVLAEAAARARAGGMDIALEIEFACVVGTGLEAGCLLERLDGVDLGLVWDPGNEARLGGASPDPAGHDAVGDRIVHVHVKDVDAHGAWRRVGDGIVGWGDELRRLAARGYDRLLALETHYARPSGGRAGATRDCARALRRIAADEGIALA